jgi:NAD(P)-dependent dehydrogenase (short-subunit alcohol dehydrogenase family)
MMKMQIDKQFIDELQGKQTLVTGGAKGIGASVVKFLQKKGRKVIVIDKENGIDIRDKEKVEDFIKKIPSLEGLVLNAALGPLHKNPTEIFETNIMGTMNILNACNRKLSKFSSVIIVASTAGYRKKWDKKWLEILDTENTISFDYKSEIKKFSSKECYGLTKWLLIQATKKFSKEFAFRKIRVNCVVPGPTRTSMSKNLWQSNNKAWQKIVFESPFKIANEPENVANLIVFLLSEDAKMITGSFVHIDGGWFCKNVMGEELCK